MKGILKPTDEKYFVDEAKGVVTYFIRFEPRYYSGKNFDITCYSFNKIIHKIYGGYRVVGIAKCSPEDTFDLKKGIQIARNRAEIKLAQVEQQVIYSILKEMNDLTENLSWLYNSRSEMIKEKKNFIKNV